LYCNNNQLTQLPELPQSLECLYCSSNQIIKLPEIPQLLIQLYFPSNNLKQLPFELPQSLTHLYCANNQLIQLPKLPQSLQYLTCNYNQLTQLPKLPQSLFSLTFANNNFTQFPDISSLDDLHLLGVDDNNFPYYYDLEVFEIQKTQKIKKWYCFQKYKPRFIVWKWKAIENIAIREGHQDRIWEKIQEAEGDLETVFC
jgi:Leucine-rich repeat (LRR) protein